MLFLRGRGLILSAHNFQICSAPSPAANKNLSLRPRSVDFTDGGATDVPILGPMELKNCISVLFFIILSTCRLQNFLRIENRTIISRDTATFVQESHILHRSFENNLQKHIFHVFFFNRPTVLKLLKSGKNI